jgi:Zn-dependent protease
MLGRLTLNPFPHIDPWLSVLMPAILWFASHGRYTFGGAKPIPVNPRKYRNYKRGDILVSGAGVATNFMLSLLFTLLFIALGSLGRWWPAATGTLDVAQRMMVWGVELNLVLACFNLIPIPPLDGSHLFYYLLPPGLGARYRELQRFGFLPLLVILLLFQPVISLLLTPAWWTFRLLLGLMVPWAVGDGWNIFAT